MSTHELMVGNIINWFEPEQELKPITVTEILRDGYISVQMWDGRRIDNYYHVSYQSFKPLELTNGWLERFGFIKDKVDSTYYKNDFEILLPNCILYKKTPVYKIKHVHQLQNLVWVLTGNELNLNKDS